MQPVLLGVLALTLEDLSQHDGYIRKQLEQNVNFSLLTCVSSLRTQVTEAGAHKWHMRSGHQDDEPPPPQLVGPFLSGFRRPSWCYFCVTSAALLPPRSSLFSISPVLSPILYFSLCFLFFCSWDLFSLSPSLILFPLQTGCWAWRGPSTVSTHFYKQTSDFIKVTFPKWHIYHSLHTFLNQLAWTNCAAIFIELLSFY